MIGIIWIAVCTKIAKRKPKKVIYRTYKNFDEVKFVKDIEMIPFHVTEVFDDNDDRYWEYSNLLLNFINVHAPVKKTNNYSTRCTPNEQSGKKGTYVSK